ncbi:hypothetical protein BGZ51_004026 [Haplosporangium sp. Z 767]|nr:hypothetical protein BGZ51_004026 [Haplosporangium sp. Z 767]KAF9183814.1 hypothetical protein BGZ50_004066 [Haplosporangium sp. Z 11]
MSAKCIEALHAAFKKAGFKGICVTKNTSESAKRDIGKNINTIMADLDYFIHIPTIDVGVDYNVKDYVDYVIGIFSTYSEVDVETSIQMMRRVQHVKSNTYLSFAGTPVKNSLMHEIDNSPNAAPESELAWKDGRKQLNPPAETVETWLHKAFREEIIDDIKVLKHKDSDQCKDGKCKQTCYRHTDSSAVGCGDHCVKGCDRHAEYLRGDTHTGFYNLLFKTTHHPHKPEGCKNRTHHTEGPACAFKSIMEAVLFRALYCWGRQSFNLWITGHSLGGALASLCMARLQTIVEKEDPLVRGLSDKEKEHFVGRTVLDVMISQFFKTLFQDEPDHQIHHCRQCRHCARADDGEPQTDCKLACRRCKILKMREARGLFVCCLEGWQAQQSEDDREITQVLSGCKKCSEQEETTLRNTPCDKCHTSCKQCGQCEPCKKEKCERYLNLVVEPKNWLVLRDCYTFASPKVGNSTFAQQFARNRIEWARSNAESQYWRVVVDGDPAPNQPAFAGYEHVGELCPAPIPPTRFENMKWYQKIVAAVKSPLEWLVGAHFAVTYYDSLSLLRKQEVKNA